jgi:hypothetical protein
MQEYIIRYMGEDAEKFAFSGEFEPSQVVGSAFERTQEARLNEFPWDENGYRPDSRARLGWNEKGLYVLMYADEQEIRTVETRIGGDVYLDSCMELFLMPEPESGLYFNFEASASAVVHLGIGFGRHGRTTFTYMPAGIRIAASEHKGGWWAVSYSISAEFIKANFGVELKEGLKMRGNFYKCADGSDKPHYGMFKGYFDVPSPDYHRPERFASFVTAR